MCMSWNHRTEYRTDQVERTLCTKEGTNERNENTTTTTRTIEFWRGSKLYEKYQYTNNTIVTHTHTHTRWVLVSISVVQKDLHETCSLTQHTAYTRHNNEAMHSTHILATCTYSTEHFVSVYAYVYALACVFVYCTILGEGIISWSVSVFVRSLFLSCHSDVSICVAVLLRRKHALCDDLTHSNGTWPANEAATGMKTSYHGNSEVGFSCCCVFVAFLFLSYSLILL